MSLKSVLTMKAKTRLILVRDLHAAVYVIDTSKLELTDTQVNIISCELCENTA